MKANELRIGNLVLLTKDDFKTEKEYRLDGIDIYKLDESECIDIKPIPLTEEWLLKFGFRKSDKNDEFGGYLSPYLPNGNRVRVKNNTWQSQHLEVKIEYVHQLQNLYFSLTNEELKYEL